MEKKPRAAAAKAPEKKVELDVEKKKGYVKVSVGGEMTVGTVNAMKKLAKELIDEKHRNFVFDLSKSTYIDSSGLGFFIGTLKHLKEVNGTLHITGMNAYISGIFNLINLGSIVKIYDDPKEACKF